MSYANLSYEDVSDLRQGDAKQRDAMARAMAAVLAGNIRVLLDELDEVLAVGANMGHVPEFWLDPMHKAQSCLERAVAQAAKSAGLEAVA